MTDKNREGERALQEKFMEYQIAQQQMGQIQKQMQQLAEQKAEVDKIQQNLSDLKDVTNGTEMLVPVASGIFAKAKIAESDELLINVGSNVVVNKSVEGAKEMLGAQKIEIMKMEEHLTAQLQKIAGKANNVEKELQKMIEEARNDV